MERKKVSVIIPVYNTAEYLPKCLDSVLGQSLKDIEVICINDCSTDNGPHIMDDYATWDDRLSVLESGGRGPGFARNLALNKAVGEYIAFVDSDDYIHPDMLRDMYSQAIKGFVDVVFCAFKKFNDNPDESFAVCNYIKKVPRSLDGIIFTWTDLQEVLFDLRFATCNKIYKREFLVDNNIRFSEDAFYEDMVFTYKALLYAKSIRLVRKQLYFNRRQRPGATTFTQGDKVLGLFSAMNELEALLGSSVDFEILKERFEAFKLEKLVDNLPKNDSAHIEMFYSKLKDYVITNQDFRKNQYLTEKQVVLVGEIEQRDFLDFIMRDYWTTKNTVAVLKRVNRNLNEIHDELNNRNTKLKKKNEKLSSKVRTLKIKIKGLKTDQSKDLSRAIKKKISKIIGG